MIQKTIDDISSFIFFYTALGYIFKNNISTEDSTYYYLPVSAVFLSY